MIVGAGTVLTTAQVDEALAAGCAVHRDPRFLTPSWLHTAKEKQVIILPGCTTTDRLQRLHTSSVWKF